MKRALYVAVAVVLGALAATAGPKLRPNSTNGYYDLPACDGGVTATLAGGSYLLSVTNETTWLCVGDAGCATAGQPLASGFTANLDFDAQPISCRSAASTGDITLTLRAPGT